MRKRFVIAAVSLNAAIAFSQSPPATLQVPKLLPPTVQGQVIQPTPLNAAPIRLPRDENLIPIDVRGVRVQRLAHQMVVNVGTKVFREYAPLTDDAELTAKLLREMMPTLWGQLGKSRIVVEYGLTVGSNGETIVPPTAGFPQSVTPMDLKTLRVEPIRGVWCVRDDASIHFNFGMEKEEAEQTLAVCRKYGFNRIGTVGRGGVPAVTYLFAAPEIAGARATNPNIAGLQAQQEKLLTRTGIEVPGVGTVGEKIVIDPRKIELRRDKSAFVIVSGNEVLANFGTDEWAARDAIRVIQDARFSEFCKLGTSGVTFFLVNGIAPTRVPFHARQTKFDPGSLRAKEFNGKWCVMDITGKPLLLAGDEAEANQLLKVMKAFNFDTVAVVGNSPTNNMRFLAKSR
ncbi:hypothetical protein BH11PLA2_BH11PLA2_00780 [soil metagenome]